MFSTYADSILSNQESQATALPDLKLLCLGHREKQFLCVFILQFLYVSKDAFARSVQSCSYSKLRTPDDEQNGRSKHVELYKDCRINTYRKCILLVCLCG